MSDEQIVIDKDSLHETKNQNNPRLEITYEDLAALPPEVQQPAPVYPGLSGAEINSLSPQKKGLAGGLGGSQIMQNLVAGIIGGAVAWLVSETIFGFGDGSRHELPVLLHVALWGAVLSATISAILGAADGITGGSRDKALRSGFIGLAVGLGGGLIGGIFGQLAYAAIGGAKMGSLSRQVFARTAGWCLLGIFIGLAQGIPGLKGKKIINGLIGGAVGGAIGGLGFDFISGIVGGGTVSRLFGLISMGAATGAAIGLIEEARKEAWLRVVDGPQSGKQFIIYGDVTRIGSMAKCEIVLVKDSAVMAEHCRIIAHQSTFLLQVNQGANVLVNGQPATSGNLRRGDTLNIGQSTMVFEVRTVPATTRTGVYAK